jgi:hypothetical protein
MEETMTQMHLGWHFCALGNGVPILRDGTLLQIGKTYEHAGMLRMCASGYHDSERLMDALEYAPGPYICRTLASGDLRDTDKRVSRYRIALAGFDATMTLHRFAARIGYCALLAERQAGREPDQRSWEAIRVKMLWCDGLANDDQLDAAQAAAEAEARETAEVAAEAAARAAAWLPAERGAWVTAWAATRAAGRVAEEAARVARVAAEEAARVAANEMLIEMLPDELTRW